MKIKNKIKNVDLINEEYEDDCHINIDFQLNLIVMKDC